MTRATIVAIAILLATRVASADDTFEGKATGALRIRHVEDIVWALTAPCDNGDEVQQRQCRQLRYERAKVVSGATMLVDADADAFEIGRWNAQKRSTPLTLSACIRCAPAGMAIDGKPWFVTGTAPRVEGGRVRAGLLSDTTRLFSDEASSNAWAKSVKTVRVELLVKVPEKRRWQTGSKDGVLLDVVGYRVISACDGSIVVANPPSSPVGPDRKACATGPSPREAAASGGDVLPR